MLIKQNLYTLLTLFKTVLNQNDFVYVNQETMDKPVSALNRKNVNTPIKLDGRVKTIFFQPHIDKIQVEGYLLYKE